MTQWTNFISWLDYSDNAGYDKNGKLTIVDAEEVRINDLKYLLENGMI